MRTPNETDIQNNGTIYTLIVDSFINALTQKIKESVKPINDFVDTYRKTHKEINKEDSKQYLSTFVTAIYYSELNYRFLKKIEKSSSIKFTHILEAFEKLKQEVNAHIASDKFQMNKELIEDFVSHKFEKEKKLVSLRQHYLIELMKASISLDGMKVDLMDNVFTEALNADKISIFVDAKEAITSVSRKIDFTNAVSIFTKEISNDNLSSEAKQIIRVYTQLSATIEQFKKCISGKHYSGSKDKEQNITISAIDSVNSTLGLNKLFLISKIYVNKHRHYTKDAFFGLGNTKTWQKVSHIIREKAYHRLLDEIEMISDHDEKIDHLMKAKTMPVFKEHSHNYIFTGAFGRTTTVKQIEKLIENARELKSLIIMADA